MRRLLPAFHVCLCMEEGHSLDRFGLDLFCFHINFIIFYNYMEMTLKF